MVGGWIEKVKVAAGSVWALWMLGVVSFLESAILPLPVDAFALPVMFANKKRLWQAAIIASVASILGGCVGYFIGHALTDTLGVWIIETYGLQEQFDGLKADLGANAAWVLFLTTLTPIPYKLAAIASGVIGYSFLSFFIVSAVGRSLRFFVIAGAIHIFGDQVSGFMERHAKAVGIVIIIGTILGFGAIYFL